MNNRSLRQTGILWALIVVALGLWVGARVLSGGVFVGDLKALLPHDARDPVAEVAGRLTQERLERRFVVIVGGRSSGADTARAAKEVRRRLVATGRLVPAAIASPEAAEALGKLYFAHRFGLLGTATRDRLVSGAGAAEVERMALRQYFAPGAQISSGLIEQDPLVLLPEFLAERLATLGNGHFTIVDGEPMVETEVGHFSVVQLTLRDSPFSIDLQEQVMPVLDAIKSEIAARAPALQVYAAGVLPHAAVGTAGAQSEVSTIGSASLVAVAVLLLVIFRSPRPLVFSLVTIGVGSLVGLAACLAVFGNVHLLTVVFAISLVGTAEDFTFHFFSTRFGNGNPWRPAEAMAEVLPSITLGLVTTLIGFLGMVVSGFPGLVQIAVFSIAGLTAAFLSTIWWYPLFSREAAPYPVGQMSRLADRWLACWDNPAIRLPGTIVLVGLAVVALAGARELEVNDDVRQFQARDHDVVADEQAVKHLLGADFAGQFLLVQGRTLEEVLQREEAAAAVLKRLEADGQIGGYLALSQFAPSQKWQRENIRMLQVAVGAGVVARVAKRVGLSPDVVSRYSNALREARPLLPSDWLAHPASAAYRQLWLGALPTGKSDADGSSVLASVVLLRGVTSPAALETVTLPDGVRLIDPVSDASDIFAHYRLRALWLIFGSYLIVAVLLVRRYGLKGGALVLAVPVAASLACVGIFGALGTGFSLFHTMALLLVLGMGVDYGIFFRESHGADRATLIAISMSVATALLSFGLLGLSRTAAISAFGQTVTIGILTAFLIAPIARPAARSLLPIMEKSHVS